MMYSPSEVDDENDVLGLARVADKQLPKVTAMPDTNSNYFCFIFVIFVGVNL